MRGKLPKFRSKEKKKCPLSPQLPEHTSFANGSDIPDNSFVLVSEAKMQNISRSFSFCSEF